jgi:IclR family transcriptional regulator, pca regulon regulatory protein
VKTGHRHGLESSASNSAEQTMTADALRTKAAAIRAALPPATQTPLATDGDRFVAETIARHADDPDFVTALARGMAVMLALGSKKRKMTIAQVSERTGIPRAAARRSLHTLSKLGFVLADDSGRFFLRPRVLTLSHAYLSTSPLAVLAQPILDRLGNRVGESCSLAILDDDEIVYLARSTSSRIMSPGLNVGRRLPAHCTSIGRVLLAHLQPPDIEGFLSRARFHRYTEYTVASLEELTKILADVRESGLSFTSQQIEARLCTLAVPVRDTGGHYVAGINVILQGRLVGRDEMAARFAVPLQEAAAELGSLLLP